MFLNDASIGLICGVSQTIAGHPLDTIKVWIQGNSLKNKNMLNINKLFLGVKYPLINNGLTGFFLFGSHDYFYNIFNNYFISGALAGIVIVPQTHITDYLKINNQMEYENKIVYNKNLFKGLSFTFYREIIGSSIYFGGYNFLLTSMSFNPFISGGLSGMFSWLFTYPIDTIKTRLQDSSKKYTVKSAFDKGCLWKGINICLVRGFLVNGTSFYIYNFLHNIDNKTVNK